MNQDEFSDAIQKAYKAALAGADAITANAALIRSEAEKELDAAKEARRVAEAEGDRITEAYFDKRRVQLMEAAVTERLRNLTRSHLEAGKSPADICTWLGVDAGFVDAVAQVVDRVAAIRASVSGSSRPAGRPLLRYQNYGRGGTIWYENGGTTFDMWWEFAGGDALVIVDVPSPEQWEARTKLPLTARTEVLTFVGETVVADHASGGSYLIGENVITIYGPGSA